MAAKYDIIVCTYRCRNCGKTFSQYYCLGVICDYEIPPGNTNGLVMTQLESVLKNDKFGKIHQYGFHNCRGGAECECTFLGIIEGNRAGIADLISLYLNKPEEKQHSSGYVFDEDKNKAGS
jgi:hypothetical protein